MNRRAEVFAHVWIPALLWIAACSSSEPPEGFGGETHWLASCATDDSCGAGSCLCGVCTEACDGDLACKTGSVPAKCYAVASPDLASRCTGALLRDVAAVCLAVCTTDADCTSGTMCLHGACLQAPEKIGTGRPGAQDFSQVDAAVDFTQPLAALPPPQTKFVQLPMELVGSWSALGIDGAPCDPLRETGVHDVAGGMCVQLDFAVTADGALQGTVHFDRDPLNQAPPSGPFPPATQADVGYPIELTDWDTYRALRSLQAEVPYAVYDATVQNGQLSFWISHNFFWTDWCALQTPHARTTAQGKTRYRCVPPTADESNTDYGKLILCSSADDGEICKEADGSSVPCVCLTADAGSDPDPRCTSATCECSADECHADLRADMVSFGLTIGEAALDGWSGIDIFRRQEVKLVRAQP